MFWWVFVNMLLGWCYALERFLDTQREKAEGKEGISASRFCEYWIDMKTRRAWFVSPILIIYLTYLNDRTSSQSDFLLSLYLISSPSSNVGRSRSDIASSDSSSVIECWRGKFKRRDSEGLSTKISTRVKLKQ